MSFSELVNPVVNIADDIPTILRAATGHRSSGQQETGPIGTPRPSAFHELLGKLREHFKLAEAKQAKLGAAELGERVILRAALRQYLAS